MVRKQLYIDESHEAALKERAARTGLSEAEIVRQALDAHLTEGPRAGTRRDRTRAVAAMDAHAEAVVAAITADTPTAADRQWSRADLYADREAKAVTR